jgi:hypothetical protein
MGGMTNIQPIPAAVAVARSRLPKSKNRPKQLILLPFSVAVIFFPRFPPKNRMSSPETT